MSENKENKQKKNTIDYEQWLYSSMCSTCPYAKKCHEECDCCEEYLEASGEMGETDSFLESYDSYLEEMKGG